MRTTKTLATILALSLLAAACGGGDDAAPADTTAPTELVLVTHDSFLVSEGTLEAFTEETGIAVEHVTAGDAGTLVNQAILTKDAPTADVLFGVDNTFLSRALEEGVFAAYESDALDGVDPSLVIDAHVTPIDFGDVCINYDVAYFSGELAPPASLEDLADPAYADLTVVQNPASSSPGLAFLLATIEAFGEDGYEDYWQSLVDNGVRAVSGWEEAYYGEFTVGGGGDRPIVVSYASSPPAEVIFAEERPTEAPTAVMTDGCFRQVEYAGILKDSESARRLVDFMLSATFQEDIPLNMFVFPAVTDTPLPPEFVEFTTLPADPASVYPADIEANRDAWIDAWTEIVLP